MVLSQPRVNFLPSGARSLFQRSLNLLLLKFHLGCVLCYRSTKHYLLLSSQMLKWALVGICYKESHQNDILFYHISPTWGCKHLAPSECTSLLCERQDKLIKPLIITHIMENTAVLWCWVTQYNKSFRRAMDELSQVEKVLAEPLLTTWTSAGQSYSGVELTWSLLLSAYETLRFWILIKTRNQKAHVHSLAGWY